MKTFHRCTSVSLCLLMLLLLLCACGNSASTPPAASDGKDYNQYLNSPGYYACTDSAWYSCPGSQIYFLDVGLESPLHPLCAKRPGNLQLLPPFRRILSLCLEQYAVLPLRVHGTWRHRFISDGLGRTGSEAAAQLLLRCHQLQLYHKFRRRVPDDLVEPGYCER